MVQRKRRAETSNPGLLNTSSVGKLFHSDIVHGERNIFLGGGKVILDVMGVSRICFIWAGQCLQVQS